MKRYDREQVPVIPAPPAPSPSCAATKYGLLRVDRGNGTEMEKSYGVNFFCFFFFEINAGMITFVDVFVYEQFGDMINILHEMCV